MAKNLGAPLVQNIYSHQLIDVTRSLRHRQRDRSAPASEIEQFAGRRGLWGLLQQQRGAHDVGAVILLDLVHRLACAGLGCQMIDNIHPLQQTRIQIKFYITPRLAREVT